MVRLGGTSKTSPVDDTRMLKVVFLEALINTYSSQVAIVNDMTPVVEGPVSLLRRLMRQAKTSDYRGFCGIRPMKGKSGKDQCRATGSKHTGPRGRIRT